MQLQLAVGGAPARCHSIKGQNTISQFLQVFGHVNGFGLIDPGFMIVVSSTEPDADERICECGDHIQTQYAHFGILAF